jgi:hypothetical protein
MKTLLENSKLYICHYMGVGKLKVYVLQETNGCEYEDEESLIAGVFKSFRDASHYLVNNHFTPYAIYNNKKEEWTLHFEKESDSDINFEGWIEEHDLKG